MGNNQGKTDTKSIFLFYILHHQVTHHIQQWICICVALPFTSNALTMFLLLPFLSLISLNSSQALGFLVSTLQAEAVLSIFLIPFLLPLSVYFRFVLELSQEFPVQPSWLPATLAVSCTTEWSSYALRSCPWRSLPCPVPLSEGLLRKALPKISTILLEEQFILVFPNSLQTKQTKWTAQTKEITPSNFSWNELRNIHKSLYWLVIGQ